MRASVCKAAIACLFPGIIAGQAVASDRGMMQCLASDLRLRWHVEEAGMEQTAAPEILHATIEAISAAQAACREGRFTEGVQLYERTEFRLWRAQGLR